MSTFVIISILLVSLILVMISGIYTIWSAEAIAKNSKYGDDKGLQSAHYYVEIASIICWVTIAGLVALGAAYLYFGSGAVTNNKTTIITLVMLLIVGLLAAIGALAAVAASEMHSSSNWHSSNNSDHEAYIDAIVAASLGVGGVGLLLIGVIVYLYTSHHRKIAQEHKEKLAVQGVARAETNVGTLLLEEKLTAERNKILQERLMQQNLQQQIYNNPYQRPMMQSTQFTGQPQRVSDVMSTYRRV